MKVLKTLVLSAGLFFHFVYSQELATQRPEFKTEAGNGSSGIVRVTAEDSVFLKIEYKGAQYDGSRANLPFLPLTKVTNYNLKANAALLIRSVASVNEPAASVIKRFFGPYLTNSFQLEAMPSLCLNENLNLHRLIPFRYNNQNEIEELTGFEISWNIEPSNYVSEFRKASNFKNQSVLSSGDWYKIAVTNTGLHKLTKANLEKLGINLSSLDPRKIQVYGNGGKMLPELNGAARIDDLEENNILVAGENDGVFNDEDYVLFYATGTDEWRKQSVAGGLKFEATKNLYSDTSFYFITVGNTNGKRMGIQASSGASPNIVTSTYDYYGFHEEDIVNFPKSGRDFYGEYFDYQNQYSFSWSEGDFVTGDSIIMKATMAAIYTDTSQFFISGNGINTIFTTPSLNVGAYLADYATVATKKSSALNNDPNIIRISITKITSKSIGYLDKLTVNARRGLKLKNHQFQFRDSRVTGPGKICQFNISTAQSGTVLILNVSDPLHPFIQDFSANGNNLSFVANSDNLNEYCIVPLSDAYAPTLLGKIPNQNLHAIAQADYVIVSHSSFLNQAKRLAAFHNKTEGYTTAVATVDEIYNEFSSGRQDISAIRDFIRMLYSNNLGSGKQVKYVLLMGDGSYKNRIRSTVNNTNFIPTYQSLESLSATSSLATDDFYGLMDANEGSKAESTGFIDVGIGRFTCKSGDEVDAVIKKIENYYKKDQNFSATSSDPLNCSGSGESTLGDWRNNLVFLADDGDKAIHMKGADNLSQIVGSISKTYNCDKIYIDAYQRVSTPGGHRYPDAAEDLVRKIKRGVMLFNYTGHGGEMGLTAERILDIATINAMDNFNKLPLFITATCEFSRYDDPGRTSAGELCLLNPHGAAIALLTTCRLAYSSTNDLLNSVVMDKLFNKMADGKRPALGDVIRLTKASPLIGGQAFYYANFHLLGDPALTLSYPEYKIITTQINHQNVTATSIDTLGALEKVTVSGFVADTLGNKLNNFNGVVYSTVFDKKQDVICLLNDPDSYDGVEGNPFHYELQRNSLFVGKTQVTAGNFSFSFLVPKDISFAYGPGKISYYATNGTHDATGVYDQVTVGGASKNIYPDQQGPEIKLYMNDKNFVSGSTTNEQPIFYADLTDSSGINTLGTSFGHDITAVLNKGGSKPAILNDFYEAALNSYQSGRVRYQFSTLSEGDYKLSFKVWDIQNNSSSADLEFVVAESADFALTHVLNYPNPFSTRTTFYFEHNQACTPLKISLQIYTVSGKQVKTLQQYAQCEGFKIKGVEWDGRDDYGDKLARGVYIYRLSVITSDNKKAEKIEKLVILN